MTPPPGRVVVVGSVNVDLTFSMPRLPVPGETVIGAVLSRSGGGKGANQAFAASALGASTSLIGLVGADEHGRSAREELIAAGVDCQGLGEGSAPTGTAAVLVDAQSENSIVVASGSNALLGKEHVVTSLRQLGGGPCVLVVSCEVPEEAVLAAVTHAEAHGWPVVLNPAPARPIPAGILTRTTFLTPNEHELEALGGVATALQALGVGTVIVTRGAGGADVVSGDDRWHQPAYPVASVDTTGAGDTFTAALAVAYGEGRDLRGCVQYAAAAGALATTGHGARLKALSAVGVRALIASGPHVAPDPAVS